MLRIASQFRSFFNKAPKMFCFQCEQTMKGQGCCTGGNCGKDSITANLQDSLIHVIKGISFYASKAAENGKHSPEIDDFVCEKMFSTLTNVNFDAECIYKYIQEGVELRTKAKGLCGDDPRIVGAEKSIPLLSYLPKSSLKSEAARSEEVGILARKKAIGEDLTSMVELCTYGLKGVCAYNDHAKNLKKNDIEVMKRIHKNIAALANPNPKLDELISQAMDIGDVNYNVMKNLDEAHVSTFGEQTPTKVRVEPIKGKCMVVTGHDMMYMNEILNQTKGKGINVYTHGEMLTTHAYPKLKMHSHLVGNYGSAWQNQQKEFDEFPGSVIFTTNCLLKPRKSYFDNTYTLGPVKYPGVKSIKDLDFSEPILASLKAKGFEKDGADKHITVGFGRHALMNAAPKVLELIKAGKIKHIFLVGGCDGAKPGRDYFTKFVEKVPKDCIILTLACGKYRFNKLEFGDIEGIPRLIDVGQCNDTYSAIQIALALSQATGLEVNKLPLSLVISWFEQKAVAVLLTLLKLGIQNIRIGPSLPAFVSPNVLKFLVDNFKLTPISTPEADLKAMLKS